MIPPEENIKDAPRHEIHVWVCLASSSRFSREALLPAEQAQAVRIVSRRKRAEFIAGRTLARHAIGTMLDIGPDAVRIATNNNGRPGLAPSTHIDFNISHAAGLVAVAAARGTRVGIDVEAIKQSRDHHAIAERFFSQSERAFLDHAPPGRSCRAFYDLWTSKEAYLKALGSGIFPNLDSTSVAPDEGRVTRGVAGDECSRWRLAMLEVPDTHRASLCWDARQSPDWHIRLHDERT